MFGMPVIPESVAVIRDFDQVFLSIHFSFRDTLTAAAWCEFLEGFLKAEAEKTGWDFEKIAVDDNHGA